MVVGRVLGWLLIIAAMVTAARDIFNYVDTDTYQPIATGKLWFDLHSTSLGHLQTIVQRYIYPGLWDNVVVPILLWPAWPVFLVPGILLAILCRKRRRRL